MWHLVPYVDWLYGLNNPFDLGKEELLITAYALS